MIAEAKRLSAFCRTFISDILNRSSILFDLKSEDIPEIISTIIDRIFELDFALKIAVRKFEITQDLLKRKSTKTILEEEDIEEINN